MRERYTNSIALVIEALHEHRGQLTETEAAELVGVSASWFRHDFKRCTTVSFRTARLREKLAYGAHLLTTTQLSINDVATLLGYSDRTKLEKAFKHAYSLTPTVFRQVPGRESSLSFGSEGNKSS